MFPWWIWHLIVSFFWIVEIPVGQLWELFNCQHVSQRWKTVQNKSRISYLQLPSEIVFGQTDRQTENFSHFKVGCQQPFLFLVLFYIPDPTKTHTAAPFNFSSPFFLHTHKTIQVVRKVHHINKLKQLKTMYTVFKSIILSLWPNAVFDQSLSVIQLENAILLTFNCHKYIIYFNNFL